MPLYGFNIEKTTSFRGVAQPFGNTYYYQMDATLTQANAIECLDSLVAKERPLFASSVTFVKGRAWTAGGTKQENNMIAQKAYSSVGTAGGGGTTLDKERAILVRFRAGNDSRGNPVYLRKWWHVDLQVINATTLSNGVLQNTEQLPTGVRTFLETQANGFKTLSGPGFNGDLRSEKNRPIDGPTTAHPYYEHHQLGDQWRG